MEALNTLASYGHSIYHEHVDQLWYRHDEREVARKRVLLSGGVDGGGDEYA